MNHPSLGNINLFVRDVAAAKRFYKDVMSLLEDEARSQPPSFALFKAGGCSLTLQDGTVQGAALGEAASVELGFVTDDVDAVRQRLLAAGAEVGEVQQMGWGGGFDARDLNGHRLTVYKTREDG